MAISRIVQLNCAFIFNTDTKNFVDLARGQWGTFVSTDGFSRFHSNLSQSSLVTFSCGVCHRFLIKSL